jgi:hypothetical protein
MIAGGRRDRARELETLAGIAAADRVFVLN